MYHNITFTSLLLLVLFKRGSHTNSLVCLPLNGDSIHTYTGTPTHSIHTRYTPTHQHQPARQCARCVFQCLSVWHTQAHTWLDDDEYLYVYIFHQFIFGIYKIHCNAFFVCASQSLVWILKCVFYAHFRDGLHSSTSTNGRRMLRDLCLTFATLHFIEMIDFFLFRFLLDKYIDEQSYFQLFLLHESRKKTKENEFL